ncbi:hypothetical protein KBX17_06305 [Corynebacterium sp. CCUG 65737]|uniref:hypothetical protein n=1 Tax=Corynebacterium sp. CCUG 65737 TaxID=2823889 RepID=UPI00210E279B|nr:hypothetical protein [Corynebacterium sp. CCUG 65737]MCQ4627423.1 hypothetical protein [Corynebacterium sp. CCUG 65737]
MKGVWLVLPKGHLLMDDLVGHAISLSPDRELTLGRAAAFPVGEDDPAMHRRFLHIWNTGGAWMIKNTGSFITARIIARGSNRFSPQRLAPGATLPLPPGEVSLTFDTKNMAYEIALVNAAAGRSPDLGPVPDAPFTAEQFEPSYEQQRLLFALAEPLWKDPSVEPHLVVPSNEELAAELGWTPKQTNQRMQRIVEALERAGVPEFRRGPTQVPRRIQLAQYASEHFTQPDAHNVSRKDVRR